MPAITWTNLVNVSVSNGVITKTGGGNSITNAGAVSVEALTGDGYFEITIDAVSQCEFSLDTSPTLDLLAKDRLYTFECRPSSIINFREGDGTNAVYKAESAYGPGATVVRGERSGTTIKYYVGGVLKYTSLVASTGTLYAQILPLDIGTSASGGVVSGQPVPSTLPSTVAVAQTNAPTSYPQCITHKNAIPLPAGTFTPPAKGDKYLDVAFNQYVIRGTDGATGTLPARADRAHRMPSAAPLSVWSRGNDYLIGTTPNGQIELFSVNTGTDPATRGRLTFVRDLSFIAGEPTFSRVTAGKLFGMVGWKLQEHDIAGNTYTTLMDLEVVEPGATTAGKYMGGTVQSSMSNPERIACFYGGGGQDQHFRVMAFDRNAPNTRVILDTQAGTINGVAIPGGAWTPVLVHSIGIDLSGQYVLIFTTQQPGQPICVIWDVTAGTVGYITTTMRPYGHNAHGWKVNVNNESVGDSPYFAHQLQRRNLDTPGTFSKVFATSVGAMGAADNHYGWENGRSDATTPLLGCSYKYYEDIPENLNTTLPRTNTMPWQPLDREIYWVDITNGNVYRVCHNRANTYSDDGSGQSAFWYQPLAHPSPNGRFIAFSSNMEKTLGADIHPNEPATDFRADIWIVDLEWIVGNDAPVVSAGTDTTITLPAGVTLSGSVTDPGGGATALWTKVSGPGSVTFASATSAATTATFSAAGTYVLRLTGTDGVLTTTDDITVTVNAAPAVIGYPVTDGGLLELGDDVLTGAIVLVDLVETSLVEGDAMNFELYKGAGIVLRFTLPVGVDPTGWQGVATFRPAGKAAFTAPLEVYDAGARKIQFTVTEAQSLECVPGKVPWDAWRTNSAKILVKPSTMTVLPNVKHQ